MLRQLSGRTRLCLQMDSADVGETLAVGEDKEVTGRVTAAPAGHFIIQLL